jgi:hypothetical protein
MAALKKRLDAMTPSERSRALTLIAEDFGERVAASNRPGKIPETTIKELTDILGLHVPVEAEAEPAATAKAVFSDDAQEFFQKNPAFNAMADRLITNLAETKTGTVARIYPDGLPDEMRPRIKEYIYGLLTDQQHEGWRNKNGISALDASGNVTPAASRQVLQKVVDFVKFEKTRE